MPDNFPITLRMDLPDSPGPQSLPERILGGEGTGSAEYAAELLTAPGALMQLSLVEARVVVGYMHPKQIDAGVTFIREGDAKHNDFMLLLLEGDVTVENMAVRKAEPVTISVQGPGSLIGEVGLLDAAPRSASCTANSSVRCAVLTREALERLIDDQPRISAKFLLAVSARVAARLRETSKKLKLYSRLASTMQQEIDQLHGP